MLEEKCLIASLLTLRKDDALDTDLEAGAMRTFLAPLPDRIDFDRIRGPSHHTQPSLEQMTGRASLSRALFTGALVILGGTTLFAAAAILEGINALPNNQQSVTGTLAVTPGKENSESLDFVLMRVGEGKAITKYDVELTKQLHVIAISDDFTTFLHDHVTRAAKDGHFRLTTAFPQPGLYHVYADSTPSGLGQQVLRFDLPVGTTQTSRTPPGPRASNLEGTDGPYTVKFDGLDLTAGQEAALTLHIEKGGKPAADLHPFLGVAAHAVFIDRDDLSYLHAHASPGSANPRPPPHLTRGCTVWATCKACPA
jgi:hypothetical protein